MRHLRRANWFLLGRMNGDPRAEDENKNKSILFADVSALAVGTGGVGQ